MKEYYRKKKKRKRDYRQNRHINLFGEENEKVNCTKSFQ